MRNNALPEAEKYAKLHKRRRVWHKVVGCLACMVVFITTYMLILPAITMEKTAYCGQEEHTHSNACYETRLVCGKEETTETPHTHTDECYEEHKVLVCGKEESAGHVHDESCVQKDTVLVCTDESEEHEHTDECYQTTESYVCGKSEGEGAHTHTDDCYDTERVLICDKEESAVTPHTHTDACYETVMVCKKKEHTHQLSCYSNSSADVESASVWERSLSGVKLTGIWADDVISVAESQIGYKESKKNYIVTEDGKTEGYTRYGDWYGNAYGDWCAMFVSFCLNYADIPQSAIPYEASCQRWIKATSGSLYYSASDYTPQKGDLIFFDWDNDGHSDHVGLVASVSEDGSSLQTIEGNSSNAVRTVRYNMGDRDIMGYAALPQNPDMAAEEDAMEATLDENAEDDGVAADTAGTYALMLMAEGDDSTGGETESTETDNTGSEAEGTETDNTENGGTNEGSGTLPVTTLSGSGTKYDSVNDIFTTKVCIDFQFNEATGKPTAGTVYNYTYPEGISVPDDIVNKGKQTLYDGDLQAGTYEFVKNEDGTYSVQIIFIESYITRVGESAKGYVQFEGTFSKSDLNNKGDIVVGGDDNIVLVPSEDITYPADATESYDINVSKSGSWVQDGDKLVYTVYVHTTKGTPDPISFNDAITIPEGLVLGNPTVTIQKGTAGFYYTSWDNKWVFNDNNNWENVEGVSFTYADGNLTSSLPALTVTNSSESDAKSEVYKITYTYPITDQTVENVSPHNNVTVSAKDTTKGQTVTDSAESTVDVSKDFSYALNKNGQAASDRPGYIKWTITVNSNKVDIAGATLTDEMLKNVESVESDIVITPSAGAAITQDEGTGNRSISFSGVDGGQNKNQYTITYYTRVSENWNDTTVTNKATLDPTPDEPGDEIEATASVTVSGVQLNKQGTFDSSTDKINWTITVNSGGLDIAGATLTDEMFEALSTTDFTIEPVSGYSFITEEGSGKITGIAFGKVENGENTQSYTIKYSTDVSWNNDGTTTSVTNTVSLTPGEGTEGTPIGSAATVKPDEMKLAKQGSYSENDSVINWKITVNENNVNIAGAALTDTMFAEMQSAEISVWDSNWQPVSTDMYEIAANDNGTVKNITFKSVGETGVNTNKYYITYTTSAQKEWNEYTVNNEAKLVLGNIEITAPAEATVPATGSVAKSAGTADVSEDGTTAVIPWTVTINVPKSGLSAGSFIEDDVTRNQSTGSNTNQWMTKAQITSWGTALNWTDENGNRVGESTFTAVSGSVTFLASDGNTYTYGQIIGTDSVEDTSVNLDELTYSKFAITLSAALIPPEGAAKLTFTYFTTMDLTKTAIGVNKFYNYINVGGKENGAEYIYHKPGIVKTDGNGKTENTTVSNEGTLTWNVKATVGEGNKQLTLIDNLPEGVTLESLNLSGGNGLNLDLTVVDETVSGNDNTNQYTVSGTYTNRSLTLIIESKTEGNAIPTGEEFTLTVTCTVDDAENQTGSKTLTNTANMKLDGGEIGSSEQTQEWTYAIEVIEKKVVDKSGGWDNTNRIMEYNIILNQEGKDLLKGSDTLTLVDTMTYTNQVYLQWPFSGTYDINASLLQSSVKLYRAVQDPETNEWIAGDEVTDWSWTYETKTGEYDWNKNNATNIITATGVPDSTPLILQYSYRITSNVPEEQDGQKVSFNLWFSNTANLAGTNYSGDNSSSGLKWEYSSESAGIITDKSYTFYKVEAGNYNVSLAGAVFSVYKYDAGTGTYGTEPVETYTTDTTGAFQINWKITNENGEERFPYDNNTLYMVKETAPPEGYLLPDTVKEFYFYFSSSEDTKHTLPPNTPTDAVDLTNEAKTVYVENIKNTTEITVEKKWQDSAGNTVSHNNGSVTINLYQKTSQGSGSDEGTGGESSGTGISYNAKCNSSNIEGTFSNVAVGDTVKISVTYTWQASLYDVQPSAWSGVSEGTGSYSNGGWTYDYLCTITSNFISFSTGDQESSIKEITCSLIEKGSGGSSDIDSGIDDSTAEGILHTTIYLDGAGGWSYTFTGLPLTGIDEAGNVVTYYYYAEEIPVQNYTTSYENNGGIQSGTITVINKADDNPEITLPETGGPGTKLYTIGGMLLMACSGFLLMYNKKRRKEDMASS